MSYNPLWNTATPPVSPTKGRQVRDKLEASPTGRAKCRRCGEKIEKGTKRVGIQGQIQTPQGYPVWRPRYYHSDCVSEETKRKLHLDPPKKRAAKRAKKEEKSTVKLKPKLRKQLEADLRGLRQSFAAMQNCDDYKIYPIKSLDDIVKRLPTNETELKECWGIKEKRCDQYGSSILRVVNFYLDQQQEQEQQKKPRGKRSASSTSARANRRRNNNTVASDSAANNDDEVEVGPTLSVEDIVAQRVRDAEARGEVFEIVDEE
ncbi:hypothetical protein ACHAXT_009651 [Thalassiosira profunda]